MITLGVYTQILSPRLQYTVNFIAGYLGLKPQFFIDEALFKNCEGVKINYTEKTGDNCVWIQPCGLLTQTGITPQQITITQKNGHPALFATASGYSFDLLSAVFYLLSRYEEYLPHQKDEYGRYHYKNSIAYKENFLQLPLINIWLHYLRSALEKASGIALPPLPFSFTPTYDIDMAWSYRGKGLWRNSGGLLQSIAKKDWTGVQNRMAVLSRKNPDPYDVYDWLDALHQTHRFEPIYFFHVGSERNRYDKSISVNSSSFQQLIKATAAKYTVGLHPSWHSNAAIDILKKEKQNLETVLQLPVIHSRQHYIFFNLPQTFRHLIALNIQHDYSMGYGSINGFRAAVTAPFFWYDLEKEEQTSLLLHPFSFMDANAFFEQKLSPAAAFNEWSEQYAVIKHWGGKFCTIWHNNILGSDAMFNGWRQVYLQAMDSVLLSPSQLCSPDKRHTN